MGKNEILRKILMVYSIFTRVEAVFNSFYHHQDFHSMLQFASVLVSLSNIN